MHAMQSIVIVGTAAITGLAAALGEARVLLSSWLRSILVESIVNDEYDVSLCAIFIYRLQDKMSDISS